MSILTMTPSQLVQAWEEKQIARIEVFVETASDWYFFIRGTPPNGGQEVNQVVQVAKP